MVARGFTFFMTSSNAAAIRHCYSPLPIRMRALLLPFGHLHHQPPSSLVGKCKG
jgi:hypothetical protein